MGSLAYGEPDSQRLKTKPRVQQTLTALMAKLYTTKMALMAAPSTGLVFLFHHLTDDVMARYATNSGKEEEVKKWPKIEL